MPSFLHRWRWPFALAVAWAGLSVWLLAASRAEVLAEFEGQAQRFVASIREDIEVTTAVGRSDANFLAHAPPVQAALEDAAVVPGVESMFEAYARAHPEVFQVRLLDARGHERVRVEKHGARVLVVEELQDKADRYYFQAAAELSADASYVSPIDLNVEHGRVERPLRPTIRFAAPVAHDQELLGVVVINVQADGLLAQLERRRPEIPGRLLVVDADGVYVSHPDPERRWGGPQMLGTGHGLDRDDPGLLEWVHEAPSSGVRQRTRDIVARAAAPTDVALPRVLLVTPTSEVLQADLAAFVPAALVIAISGTLSLTLVLVWQRQRQLAVELAREAELRQTIADREQNLRQAQERLVASARLAALSASAAALAHELRNPLGAIVNSAGLLRKDASLDEDSRALMDIVVGEGKRLERAVAQFVDLARRPDPRPERVELDTLVAEVVALARLDPACGEGLELELEMKGDTPPVLTDPDEMRQVLWNLLRNAGSATRKAGGRRVRVSVRPDRLDDDRLAGALVIEDEGQGPPTSDDTSRWPMQGSGLGLIVVAGVVARHGGDFELRARPQQAGACAIVRLPAAQGHPRPEATGPARDEEHQEKPWPSS